MSNYNTWNLPSGNPSTCPICKHGTWIELGGGIFQENTEGTPVYHPNIEARSGKTVDIVCDFEVDDIPLHDGHAARIKMMHFFQHLGVKRARELLQDCHRVLKPDGLIIIMVGDIEYLCQKILQDGLEEWLAMSIWGEQEHQYDFHKWGYSFETLSAELTAAGFDSIAHRGHYNPWEFLVTAVRRP